MRTPNSRTHSTVALVLALAACSDTGVTQVDRGRDRVLAEVGIGDELKPVVATADGAVRRTVAAGGTGDPVAIAGAVGRGTAEVLCAGAGAKAPAARAVARTAERQAGDVRGVQEAASVLRGVADAVPDLPGPC